MQPTIGIDISKDRLDAFRLSDGQRIQVTNDRIGHRTLLRWIGRDDPPLVVSEATVSRWKRGESLLEQGSKPFELAALLVRTFRSLDAITGGDEAVARRWLQAPNTALAARPVERMAQVQGLVDVTTYLDARRAPL